MDNKKPRPSFGSIVPAALMIMGGIVFLINQISLLFLFLKLKNKSKPKTPKTKK